MVHPTLLRDVINEFLARPLRREGALLQEFFTVPYVNSAAPTQSVMEFVPFQGRSFQLPSRSGAGTFPGAAHRLDVAQMRRGAAAIDLTIEPNVGTAGAEKVGLHTVRKKLVRTIEIARRVDKDLNSELHVALDELRLDFVIATSRCDVSFSGEGDADRADDVAVTFAGRLDDFIAQYKALDDASDGAFAEGADGSWPSDGNRLAPKRQRRE